MVDAVIRRLVEHPELGPTCDHIRVGYRRHPVGSHILFYRIADGGVHVVRILHRHMDIGKHL